MKEFNLSGETGTRVAHIRYGKTRTGLFLMVAESLHECAICVTMSFVDTRYFNDMILCKHERVGFNRLRLVSVLTTLECCRNRLMLLARCDGYKFLRALLVHVASEQGLSAFNLPLFRVGLRQVPVMSSLFAFAVLEQCWSGVAGRDQVLL